MRFAKIMSLDVGDVLRPADGWLGRFVRVISVGCVLGSEIETAWVSTLDGSIKFSIRTENLEFTTE